MLRADDLDMNVNTSIDSFVVRLRLGGADIRPLGRAPWVDEIERKLKFPFPPAFRSLIERYAFPLLDIGEVELFANEGDGSQYDLAVAPFSDPYMSPWLIKHRLIYIGHPYIGNYDPICLDLSHRGNVEPPVVQLNHEDILLEREVVKRKMVAANFLALIERALLRSAHGHR